MSGWFTLPGATAPQITRDADIRGLQHLAGLDLVLQFV
jgi:hypothetical protein